MDTSPAILRLHPELDAGQRGVIAHRDGPLLVIAGPGSGKTLCIQLRAVNLLLTRQCLPTGLVLCTFGRNAARRLEQRFLRSARVCGVPGDPSRVRISTVHSLCHRILAPHAGAVGLRPGYRLLDESEQQLLMQQEFDAVLGPDWDTLARRGWREGVHGAAEAARYFDRIGDELIDADVLAGSERPFLAAVGRSCQRYRQLLRERNLADFSHLQVWAHRVLQDDDIAAAIGGDIRHLMVDEYQDVSRVQMGILQRLAGAHGNIAVVGDDDQAIHRFRGASVASILEFPNRFPGCRVLGLTTNYRSCGQIVVAAGRWMDSAAQWEVEGRSYRYAKSILPHRPEAHPDYPAVISVQGRDPVDEAGQLAALLRFMVHNGVIGRYGQASLLLHSVRDGVSGSYLDGLERAGIPVRCEPAGHDRVPAGDELLVTTIHQAKGREWHLVIVGSLTGPEMATDRIGRNLADYGVYSGEPESLIGELDRARAALHRFHTGAPPAGAHRQRRTAHQVPLHLGGGYPLARTWTGPSLGRQRFGAWQDTAPRQTVDIDRLDRLVVRLAPPG